VNSSLLRNAGVHKWLHLFSHVWTIYANSILFKTSTSSVSKLQGARTRWHGLFSQISGPLQLHLSYFAYTGYRLSHAKKIQTGNYYLQISSTTNLPASATSAASTRSTTVRVVKCMCVCMEFSSVQFIRCEHGFKCNSGESISAAVFATRSVNDFTPIHGTLGNIKLFFYGGPRCHDSNLLTAQIVTAAYSQQIGLSAFSAFLSSRHNSVLYCFYYIVSVLINKYSFI